MTFKDMFKSDTINETTTKTFKANAFKDKSTIEESANSEETLIKNNVKIKKKFDTKFGTEFVLAKKYDEDDIKKILKTFRVTFDGNSIFVQK